MAKTNGESRMNSNDKALRVLLVEDCKSTSQHLRELFQLMFRKVSLAVAATEKAALASAVVEQPDLVLLDLNLKRGSGLRIIQKLKAVPSPPTVIVLTNFAIPMYRDLALLTGADYFLDKAFDLDALPRIVESVVEWRGIRMGTPFERMTSGSAEQESSVQSLH
jgi:DNA-binding response OmpR family regulator